MGIEGWSTHECQGPITSKETRNGIYYEWRTCTECGLESLALGVNLRAVAKLDLADPLAEEDRPPAGKVEVDLSAKLPGERYDASNPEFIGAYPGPAKEIPVRPRISEMDDPREKGFIPARPPGEALADCICKDTDVEELLEYVHGCPVHTEPKQTDLRQVLREAFKEVTESEGWRTQWWAEYWVLQAERVLEGKPLESPWETLRALLAWAEERVGEDEPWPDAITDARAELEAYDG